MRLVHFLLIPFAILHLRYIQWRYREITINNLSSRSNMNIARLRLLQAKEEYYRSCFEAWGIFHPEFTFTQEGLKRHHNFLNWLFPKKSFEEWDIVVWYKKDAITYYQNKIYTLTKGRSPNYFSEIKQFIKQKQIKES